MRLFRRRALRERETAAALAARGVPGRARVISLQETGTVRGSDTREVELVLDVELPGREPLRVAHVQFMSRYVRHGLAPGAPARVFYDPADPRTLVVTGHPAVRSAIVDGQLVLLAALDGPRTP